MLVAEWLDDVRYWHEQFQRSLKEDKFPRSPHSCQSKFGQCPYVNLCRAQPTGVFSEEPPEGFVVDEWKPFTTEIVHGD